MVGCGCEICRSSDPRDSRSRASILIQHEGKNILVDTSTDLRQQMLRENVCSVDAVLFTHTHADHVNGIDDLRGFYLKRRRMIPCYAENSAMERLLAGFGYIFSKGARDTHPPLMEGIGFDSPFRLFGLEIIPIPLEHGEDGSSGYRIGSFAYLTDCSLIPDSSMKLLEGLDTLLIDGLRWRSHPYHFNIDGAIEAARAIGSRRTVLTHLTHDVMYADRTRLPGDIELAYDGMVLEF